MKYNEEEYKKLVAEKYNGEIKVVGKYIGISKPILVEDKYGVMEISHASLVLQHRPSILCALNKTEYILNMLK